jgi:hypothetical protein
MQIHTPKYWTNCESWSRDINNDAWIFLFASNKFSMHYVED